MLRADYPINKLAAATVAEAMKAAAEGSVEAFGWLITDGVIWLEAIGIDLQPSFFLLWLDNGCPMTRTAALRRQRKKMQ